jgi:branched-chain amino acid transport system ATP-binding protein
VTGSTRGSGDAFANGVAYGSGDGPVAGAAGPAALALHGVTVRFGGLVALDGLSFEVAPRSVFGVIGPNGAGKTTLLNVISGFTTPTAGHVTVFGEKVPAGSVRGAALAGVARTYQNVRLFPGLTVEENIVAGRYRHRRHGALKALLCSPAERRERRESYERARHLMRRVGLDDSLAGRRAETLSYGDQRRCEVARALATEPRVLLLDEPTAGMNAAESRALGDLVLKLRDEGVTIVLVEHNMDIVQRYCESAAVINFGRLLAAGPPRECLRRDDVREAYFGGRSDAERVRALLRVREDKGAPPG